MNAVIVCIASPGLNVRFGVPPAAIEHDHRLADGPRDAEHERGDDARQGGRDDDAWSRPRSAVLPSA